ncbi:hypothetical protein DRN44_00640 [Thermococci archaeon]|nr:MAG: hypothetical protein DRN44_00640 [Thermococci archaeon]
MSEVKKLVEGTLNEPIIVSEAWKSLEEALPSGVNIKDIDAIIIPGGPGITKNIQKTYPFLREALDRGILTIFLGAGSYMFPCSITAMHSKLDGKINTLLYSPSLSFQNLPLLSVLLMTR